MQKPPGLKDNKINRSRYQRCSVNDLFRRCQDAQIRHDARRLNNFEEQKPSRIYLAEPQKQPMEMFCKLTVLLLPKLKLDKLPGAK